MDNCHEETDKPPPVLDIASRGIPTPRLFLREVQRCMGGLDAVTFVRGSGLRRRNIDMQNIRAEG